MSSSDCLFSLRGAHEKLSLGSNHENKFLGLKRERLGKEQKEREWSGEARDYVYGFLEVRSGQL